MEDTERIMGKKKRERVDKDEREDPQKVEGIANERRMDKGKRK